jgi:hypothetical protein
MTTLGPLLARLGITTTLTPLLLGLGIQTTLAPLVIGLGISTTLAPVLLGLGVPTTLAPLRIKLDIRTTLAPLRIKLGIPTTLAPLRIKLGVATTLAPLPVRLGVPTTAAAVIVIVGLALPTTLAPPLVRLFLSTTLAPLLVGLGTRTTSAVVIIGLAPSTTLTPLLIRAFLLTTLTPLLIRAFLPTTTLAPLLVGLGTRTTSAVVIIGLAPSTTLTPLLIRAFLLTTLTPLPIGLRIPKARSVTRLFAITSTCTSTLLLSYILRVTCLASFTNTSTAVLVRFRTPTTFKLVPLNMICGTTRRVVATGILATTPIITRDVSVGIAMQSFVVEATFITTAAPFLDGISLATTISSLLLRFPLTASIEILLLTITADRPRSSSTACNQHDRCRDEHRSEIRHDYHFSISSFSSQRYSKRVCSIHPYIRAAKHASYTCHAWHLPNDP